MTDAPDRWRSRGRVFLVIRLLGGRGGGAERLFCDMANMLADEGFEVTCLHCDSTHEPPLFPLSPKVGLVNLWSRRARNSPAYKAVDLLGALPGGPAAAPFDWLSKNLYFVRRLHAAMEQGRPDVVISFLPPANTPCLIAGALSRAKVVPTNHNVPEQDYRSRERWDQNPVDRFLRFWTLHAAERVHVIFPTFAEWFPGRIRKKVVAIPNSVSPEFWNVDVGGPRRKEIAAAGRLAPVKNYLDLVDAWAIVRDRHPDWRVVIYGTGPQRKELERRIAERGLNGVVQLMGHASDMKKAYLGAEIFCHPALHEGFGLSAAEALACGLPVVAYADCAGVNEFVRDGENGLMADRAGGPAALAGALERLVSDEELRRQMRVRAPESIRRFSQERFRRNWVGLIDELAKQEGRS